MRDRVGDNVKAGCRAFLPEGEQALEGIMSRRVHFLRGSFWRNTRAKELLKTWPLRQAPSGEYHPDVIGEAGVPMSVVELDGARLAIVLPSRAALARLLERHEAAVAR